MYHECLHFFIAGGLIERIFPGVYSMSLFGIPKKGGVFFASDLNG